jgi:hypothetical protein
MSFCDKCIDRTDIRIGDYWSAFEGSEEALPFFQNLIICQLKTQSIQTGLR